MTPMLTFTGVAVKPTHFNNATRRMTIPKGYSFFILSNRIDIHYYISLSIQHNDLILGCIVVSPRYVQLVSVTIHSYRIFSRTVRTLKSYPLSNIQICNTVRGLTNYIQSYNHHAGPYSPMTH